MTLANFVILKCQVLYSIGKFVTIFVILVKNLENIQLWKFVAIGYHDISYHVWESFGE